jgi:hypothetical protein
MNVRPRIRFGWQSIAGLTGALIILLSSAGATAADTSLGHRGKVGPHHLIDTAAHPGAKCFYVDGAGGGDEDIDHIRVRPPVVYARNTTAGQDQQTVGWRARIQRLEAGSSTWTTDQTSGIHLATAWDNTPASFNTIQLSVVPHYGSKLRVRVLTYWYKSGSVVGLALNEVDWYRKIYKSTEFGDDIATLHQRCADYYPG